MCNRWVLPGPFVCRAGAVKRLSGDQSDSLTSTALDFSLLLPWWASGWKRHFVRRVVRWMRCLSGLLENWPRVICRAVCHSHTSQALLTRQRWCAALPGRHLEGLPAQVPSLQTTPKPCGNDFYVFLTLTLLTVYLVISLSSTFNTYPKTSKTQH